VVALLWLPETKGARAAGGAAGKAPPSFGTQLRTLTVQRAFLLVSLTSFSAAVVRAGGIFSLIPLLGQERSGLGADQIGFGLALASLIGLVLTYPSGVLVDRFGRKTVIVPAMLLNALSLGCFLVASSYLGYLAGCVVWGIAIGVTGPAPAAYAADMAPPGMNAAAMSAFRMMADAGYVLGPLVMGLVADLFGTDAALLGTAAMLVAVGLLFGQLAPETYRRSAPAG
jgi:MFS family permease